MRRSLVGKGRQPKINAGISTPSGTVFPLTAEGTLITMPATAAATSAFPSTTRSNKDRLAETTRRGPFRAIQKAAAGTMKVLRAIVA